MASNKIDFEQKKGEVLQFISRFISDNGYSPTVREICERFPMSTSSMHYLLHALQDASLISWQPRKPRTIRVLS